MSSLEFVRPLLKFIPEVRLPKRHVSFKEKITWTLGILVLFFVMGTIYPIGVSQEDLGDQQALFLIFASKMGSILSVGIGPIVTASIILQLLVGSKMLDLDLTKAENKALFQGTQKILTVLVALFESFAVVVGFRLGSTSLGESWALTHPLVLSAVFQIAVGSILLMYLDEIVSKWGVGSGIGLFIAGGVSQEIVSASLNFLKWVSPSATMPLGILPQFFQTFIEKSIVDWGSLLPVLSTILIFLAVVYAEAMRLEIPLSYGGVRGVGGRYPLKFLYVSNIPVILTAALLANVQLFSRLAGINNVTLDEMSIIQKIVYYITEYLTLGNLSGIFVDILANQDISPLLRFETILHIIIYTAFFIFLCILFGKFWVETTGLSAENVAEQIQRGGMQIPGFRRDKRVVERVLNKYIPPVTIISSVAIGLLSVGADFIGAISGGTSILLTVGILYRLYEEIQKEQMADVNPALRKFLGKQ